MRLLKLFGLSLFLSVVMINMVTLDWVMAKSHLVLPSTINVVVLRLCNGISEPGISNCTNLNRGSPRILVATNKAELCTFGDVTYGCGRNGYPFTSNPVNLTLEDYVTDVVPNELGANHPVEAMKAEAVAARTVGAWKARYYHKSYWPDSVVGNMVDNSTFFQLYLACTGREDSPCPASGADDIARQVVEQTTGINITYGNDIIDAEYRTETGNPTKDNTFDKAYFKSVYDPVRPTEVITDIGMGHNGAINWAEGQGYNGNLFPCWNYRQILAHYYTNVDIQDGSGTALTPDFCWNPLNVEWSGVFTPPVMHPGGTYTVTVVPQNTGDTWEVGDWIGFDLGYYWQRESTIITGTTTTDLNILDSGDGSTTDTVTLAVEVPNTFNEADVVTLNIDVLYPETSWGSVYSFLSRREGENRPWYPLKYVCEIGQECHLAECGNTGTNISGGIYLPIITKNSS